MEITAGNADWYLPETKSREPNQILGKDDFLLIMMEQLKHQDPMSPVDSDKFLGQMAQFTVMEQLVNLNTQFTDMMHLQQVNNASALIGKQVSLTAGEDIIEGAVEKVLLKDQAVQVVVGGIAYDLEQVNTVK